MVMVFIADYGLQITDYGEFVDLVFAPLHLVSFTPYYEGLRRIYMNKRVNNSAVYFKRG